MNHVCTLRIPTYCVTNECQTAIGCLDIRPNACVHLITDCNDNRPCTDDLCNPQTGCFNPPDDNNSCSDGNVCTVGDYCVEGDCNSGAPQSCDDGQYCNGPETCDSASGCHAGTAPNCDDGVACTLDACNENTDSCANIPSNAACDDGLFCTLDTCDPATGTCGNPPNPCSDGDGCTVDSCDETDDTCGHAYACAQVCNTGRIIINDSEGPPEPAIPYPSEINVSGASGVVSLISVRLLGLSHTFPADIDILLAGPAGENAIIMSDVGDGAGVTGVDLTLSDGAALSLPDDAPLVSGTFQPTNAGAGDAFAPPAPVPSGGSALSVFDGTVPNGTWKLFVVDDAGLDVGAFAGGWCLNYRTTCHTADDCDDGNACTDDDCHPVLGCVHANNAAPCSDGDECTVDDTCGGGACIPGVLAACNDNNRCTDDSCAPANGCVYTPDNTNDCSDDDACNGVETCSQGGCLPGTPLACNDNNPCTADTCAASHCVNVSLPPATPCLGSPLCLGEGTCDGSGLCVCECTAALQITTTPEPSCGETRVRVKYKSECALRGFDFTLVDMPNWLMLPDPPECTTFLGFNCTVASAGAVGENARAIILPTNLVSRFSASSSFIDLAEIRFVGTPDCLDCATPIELTTTDSIAADTSNAPVPVMEAAASIFTPCPCEASKGNVDCVQDYCTLFDLIDAVDQALNAKPDSCEADVADTACNGTVDLFDLLCLLDCAFGEANDCGQRHFCAGGTLPSGCTPVAVVASGRSTLENPTQPTVGPETRMQPSGDEGLPGSAVVSVVGSRLWGSRPRTSDVNVEDATRGIRGLSFTFEVPLGWVATEVEALGIPTSFQPRFHQKGQELRVIVFSIEGAVIPAGSGPTIRVHLNRTTSALQRGSQELKLVSAEAADEHGQPFAVDVTVGSLGDRTPRAKPVSDPLVP